MVKWLSGCWLAFFYNEAAFGAAVGCCFEIVTASGAEAVSFSMLKYRCFFHISAVEKKSTQSARATKRPKGIIHDRLYVERNNPVVIFSACVIMKDWRNGKNHDGDEGSDDENCCEDL